jgi:hypothetical protein
MNAKRVLLTSALSAVLVGCGGDDQLDEAENVRIWMTTASALAVYANASEELRVADGRATFPDPACPVTSDDGTVLTITGGCTDDSGTTYAGGATIERSGDDVKLTLSGYGSASDQGDLVKRRGTVTRTLVSDAFHSFDANLVVEGGMRTTITYRGSVSGDYDTRTVWSGHGRISRDGMVAPTGTVEATTENEVVDDSVCSGQPLAGRTTIETEDQNAVVFYDGERDCDMAQRAHFRVDGEERGTLTGITCSLTNPGRTAAGHHALVAATLLFIPFVVRRSQRREARA